MVDTDLHRLLCQHRSKILEIAARHGAQRVRIFGSAARGNPDERSDVDFLIDLATGRSLLELGAIQYELNQLLGVPVDVVTEKGLRKRIRAQVLAEAVDL